MRGHRIEVTRRWALLDLHDWTAYDRNGSAIASGSEWDAHEAEDSAVLALWTYMGILRDKN